MTVIIPTLNEAVQIREAVEVLSWADEIIVADGGSTDHTPELAREAGATVIDARGGTIASQRNAGIAAASNPWILALDADERVPDQLRDEIAAVLEAPRHEAYRIRFRNFFLGREIRHGRWGNEFHVRLFRADRRFQVRSVHESLETVHDVGTVRACLEHSPYRDLSHQIEKMARYARWGAEDLAVRGRQNSVADLTFRPVWRFVREYIVFSGWKDGRAGLLLALLSACSAFLKYAHLQALDWQIAAQTKPIAEPLPIPARLADTPQEAWPITLDS